MEAKYIDFARIQYRLGISITDLRITLFYGFCLTLIEVANIFFLI